MCFQWESVEDNLKGKQPQLSEGRATLSLFIYIGFFPAFLLEETESRKKSPTPIPFLIINI